MLLAGTGRCVRASRGHPVSVAVGTRGTGMSRREENDCRSVGSRAGRCGMSRGDSLARKRPRTTPRHYPPRCTARSRWPRRRPPGQSPRNRPRRCSGRGSGPARCCSGVFGPTSRRPPTHKPFGPARLWPRTPIRPRSAGACPTTDNRFARRSTTRARRDGRGGPEPCCRDLGCCPEVRGTGYHHGVSHGTLTMQALERRRHEGAGTRTTS